jgi:hypothetical protein
LGKTGTGTAAWTASSLHFSLEMRGQGVAVTHDDLVEAQFRRLIA